MRSRPVLVGLLSIGFLVAAAVGCRRPPEEGPPPFRVHLLTSLPQSGRWELAAEQGLGRIAADLGAEVARQRAADDAERRALLAAEAGSGVDLVFCVGPGFERGVMTEASAYPASRFVLLLGSVHAPNVSGIAFLPEGAGFVAGAVAARLAVGSGVGVLRGSGGEWLESLEEGFVAGVRSVRPEGEVASLSLPAGPRELVRGGIGVALYATDRVDPEVFDEARRSDLLLIACDADLIQRAPDVVAAAVRIDVAEAMVRVAREVRDHTFQGKPYVFDLGSGVLDVVLNPAAPAAASPEVRDALEVARSEVTAGIVELEKLGPSAAGPTSCQPTP